MAKWKVNCEVSMRFDVDVEVEARDEEDAIEKAEAMAAEMTPDEMCFRDQEAEACDGATLVKEDE